MRNGFDLGSGDTVSRFTSAAKLAVSLHITKNIILNSATLLQI